MEEYLDSLLSTDLAKVAKCRMRQLNKCNKMVMPSGMTIYEYDSLEVIAMSLELISRIKQIRGIDI